MRFFNVDLHIPVIADIRHIFARLGHSVDSWSLSSHNWVFDRKPDAIDVLTKSNWAELTPKMCDAFFERYREELSVYDGFITSYVPGFSLLFERFQKPIIFICPIRYEHPFTDNPEKWDWLNRHIKDGVAAKKIFPVANNKFDALYFTSWTNCPIQTIPSLCEYTGETHNPRHPYYICKSVIDIDLNGSNILNISNVFPHGHSWRALYSFQGIVHFPYQCSTMSIFEQYTAGVPLLFPTKRFSKEIYWATHTHGNAGYLCQASFNRIKGIGPKSLLTPKYSDLDLNDFSSECVLDVLINLSDFYDNELMPAINYFDNFSELGRMTKVGIGFQPDNRKMRREMVYEKWKNVIAEIF